MNIVPLFSKPVVATHIDISQAPNLENQDWILSHRNDKNLITRGHELLDQPGWENIKQQIDGVLDEFFHEHLLGPEQMNIKITDSWLNRSEHDMFRGRHNHPNSYYSGVIYFEEHPCALNLYNPHIPQVYATPRDSNILNSHHWRFTPEPGLIILFPSYMEHDTDMVNEQEHGVRHSLAFDTWIDGLWDRYDDPVREVPTDLL